jgi:hypothetical protein
MMNLHVNARQRIQSYMMLIYQPLLSVRLFPEIIQQERAFDPAPLADRVPVVHELLLAYLTRIEPPSTASAILHHGSTLPALQD